VTRGEAEFTVKWATAQAEGEVRQIASGGAFEPIDPNDVPKALRQFAEDWNAGLEELNANVDKVFPDRVLISHPHPCSIKVANPDDPNLGFEGLNRQDGFVAQAVGSGLGTAGASVLSGQWDGQDTVSGAWSVGWGVADDGVQQGLIVIVTAAIPYEAVLVPEN
jgi:hypothetical protein